MESTCQSNAASGSSQQRRLEEMSFRFTDHVIDSWPRAQNPILSIILFIDVICFNEVFCH